MYGCFDPYLVYGFCENDRDSEIDPDLLWDVLKDMEAHDDICAFAMDVVRNHGGDTVYGVIARLNSKTGEATVDQEDREKIEKLYERVCKKNKKRYSELGFHLGIRGDVENCHGYYNPDESQEEEEVVKDAEEVEAEEKRQKVDH